MSCRACTMVASTAELLVTVLVYTVSLSLAGLSNVWLSVWGRRLSLLNSYFRSHQQLLADDDDSVRIDPFDLAALEASMSAATPATATATAAGDSDHISPSPVFDLGLHFLPHLHCRWLPDAFVFVFLALVVAAVFVPAAARYRRIDCHYQQYWPPVLRRLCCVLQSHSVVLLMRSSTTLATVHRASPVCHALSLESSVNPGFVLNTGCFDLMFSGHTAFCVLAAFFICHRPELGWMGQGLTAMLAAVGSVSNVMVGDHFTADCLVAAHIAVLVCCLFRQQFKGTFTRQSAGVARQQSAASGHTASLDRVMQTSSSSSPGPSATKRGASRHKAAAASDHYAQLMDVDEQRTAQQDSRSTSAAETVHVHDAMAMDVDWSEGSDAGGDRLDRQHSDRDECVEEEKELQQLINRWQLADSHSAATTAKRHIRRHTDIR